MDEPEKLVAMKIVDQYRKMFDFLDYKPVDDILNAEELSEAYKEFNWPKGLTDITDDLDYAQYVIKNYDTNKKNGINFVEFCKYMEELWSASDQLQEQRCDTGFQKSKETFTAFFKWLDRDNDGFITMEDCIYGISRMMFRDVDFSEVKTVFELYDKQKTGKIDVNTFMLAIANGKLDKTFKDPNFTDTMAK